MQDPSDNINQPRTPPSPPNPQPQRKGEQKRARHLYQHRDDAETFDRFKLPGEINLWNVLHSGQGASNCAEVIRPCLRATVIRGVCRDGGNAGKPDTKQAEENRNPYGHCVAASRPGLRAAEAGGGGGEIRVRLGWEEGEK